MSWLDEVAARAAIEVVADKRVLPVIKVLSEGPRRRVDLQKAVSGVTASVLTATLRRMERDGLVTRLVYPEVPVRVEYRLTPLCETLRQPLAGMATWTRQHLPEIQCARTRYDEGEMDEAS